MKEGDPMRFQKINDNVIRCYITKEEMISQGVDIEDLMADRSKAEDFLRYILQQAHYEVDFNVTGEALNVQMSVMQGGDVSLMISDDQNMAIRAMLDQLREKLKGFQRELSDAAGKGNKLAEDIIAATRKALEEAAEDDPLEFRVWAELDDIDQVLNMARALSYVSSSASRLYKFEDRYYFCLDFVQTKKEIAGSVFVVAEYADRITLEQDGVGVITEHGELIIKEDAIAKLAAVNA